MKNSPAKTLRDWLDEYNESHLNSTNQILHKICVPLIFFTVLGLLSLVHESSNASVVASLATVLSIPALVFYFHLGLRPFVLMLLVFILSLLILDFLNPRVENIWIWYGAIFIFAWIGQFIGHKVEGKKPSFFQDLSFLLIGPLWTMKWIFKDSK